MLTDANATVDSALALTAKATQCDHEFCEETIPMAQLYRSELFAVVLLAGLPTLVGCSSMSNPFTSSTSTPPPAAPVVPPSVHAEDIVGRWGLASYHRDQDRARTQAAAKSQCAQPYAIEASPSGGVMMLGHDSPKVQDMTLKGSAEGKTYIGPGGDPAGADDREVVSFDGRVMILKWVDPEVAGRYGNMVLVRCGAEGTTPERTARVKKKSATVQQ
jgi:hypothetical protein